MDLPTPVSTTTNIPAADAPDTPGPVPTPTPDIPPTATEIPLIPAESVTLRPILEGVFERPLYLTHAGDERLFVVEEPGTVRVIQDGRLAGDVFLDIRDRVASNALEQGLLGLAFSPDFAENGTFYVNYTNLGGNTHISRFRIDPLNPAVADPQSEEILMQINQPAPNHNGGQLAFGPDGYLYIGVGDGGGAGDVFGNGQNPSTLLGTLLRLDVSGDGQGYVSPAGNPFVAMPERPDEIWAWGLRNPWRFSFDRLNGDLFIADVGQNLWEEVDLQSADSQGGENYGWNILEGSHCFLVEDCDTAGLELPIFEYSHQEGCSITGGYMHRGSKNPVLNGNYFAADYCQGKIWRLFQEASGEWSPALVLDTDLVISSFGEGQDGELYVLDHVGGSLFQVNP